MSILTANINFLASLGIVNQEQFETVFGDMDTFDDYCSELGYTWEIDENNDIILTTPHGKSFNSGVSVLITAEPEITTTVTDVDVTVEAIGEGTVKLYADGTEVSNPVVFYREDDAQEITFTATAQAEGKIISAEVEEDIVIPAKVPDYMKLSALGNGNITITIPSSINAQYATSISYSKDAINWTDTAIDDTEQTITIPVVAGDVVYLKGIAKQWANSYWLVTTIKSTADYSVRGNIMSLFYGDNFKNQTSFPSESQYNLCSLFSENIHPHLIDASRLILPATTLTEYCYYEMFRGCTSLTSAPVLPATTLTEYCYYRMFRECTSLTSAPVLPATTLTEYCYYEMFYGCTSLTSAPELPATTLADACYNGMFGECTSLTSAPALPATTLVNGCYSYMFRGCTSLTSAPVLPATTLTQRCYSGMFYGCTSLTSAPELPVTTLADYCYSNMFYGCTSLTSAPTLPVTTLTRSCYSGMFGECTSLTSAPVLPATTLTQRCYSGMFGECTSLTSAPVLPATTLADECYADMFYGCTSLTSAPELPATTLADACYYDMFYGCTSLTSAPVLPATTLTEYCYYDMFYGCTSLNSITMLATDISASDCLSGWVDSVASTGTFTKAAAMTTLPTGDSGIPSGWTVVDA